jgi:hypothetical protein
MIAINRLDRGSASRFASDGPGSLGSTFGITLSGRVSAMMKMQLKAHLIFSFFTSACWGFSRNMEIVAAISTIGYRMTSGRPGGASSGGRIHDVGRESNRQTLRPVDRGQAA